VTYIRSVLDAEGNARRFTDESEGGTGVVLRFGYFYGPDSHTTHDMFRLARLGAAPVMGAASAYQSSISTDDAAAAVVAALGAPAGVYNVADDEPLTKREYADIVAATVGAPRPVMVPRAALRLAGSKAVPLSRSQRISNGRFKAATGWAPDDRSVREGLPRAAGEMGATRVETSTVVRVLLAVLALSSLGLGVYALLSPSGFYESFPSGRGWVALDGPYNEHLVRDFGGLNLGLGLVLAAAAATGGRTLARVAAVSGLLFAVPHLAYHAANLEPYGTGDAIANIATLSVGVVLAVAVLALTRRHPGSVAAP
jgi:hypothetical protein